MTHKYQAHIDKIDGDQSSKNCNGLNKSLGTSFFGPKKGCQGDISHISH